MTVQVMWVVPAQGLTLQLPQQTVITPFNHTITAQTLLAKCDDYRFQRSILQFPALGKNIESQACSS